MIKLIGIALLSFAIASCEKFRSFTTKPSKITGQIFVVPENRTNVKLGGVEVYYVPREHMEVRLKWIARNQKKAQFLRTYRSGLSANDFWIKSLGASPVADITNEFQASAQGIQREAWKRYNRISDISELEAIDRFLESAGGLFDDSTFNSSYHGQWAISCLFFNWIQGNFETKTISDADGNFRVTVPESRPGFLLASASRSVPLGRSENYFWIKKIEGNDPDPIIMHSSDCIDEGTLTRWIYELSTTEEMQAPVTVKSLKLVDPNWTKESQRLVLEILKQETDLSIWNNRIEDLKKKKQTLLFDHGN